MYGFDNGEPMITVISINDVRNLITQNDEVIGFRS